MKVPKIIAKYLPCLKYRYMKISYHFSVEIGIHFLGLPILLLYGK